MGIRRRRRKLSTLMSRLDERVQSVELRSVNLLTEGQINNAIESGQALSPPQSFVGPSAPNSFHKIEDAYIYPKALGLPEDRVEIYLEVDLGAEKGDILEISGIHGTQSHDIDVDGDSFVIKNTDTPPWDGRNLPNGQIKHDPTANQRSGVTITNAYSVKPETQAPQNWNSRERLQTRRAVNSYSITDNTVSLTMNAVHKFKSNDVVYVDIFSEDSRAFGADGLFRIDSVTSNTITYKLNNGVDTPTGIVEVAPLSVHVFPVGRKFARVGSTWTNSTDNTIYYWDGIRWVTWSAGSVEADNDPPSPPTNLNITDTPSVSGTTFIPHSKVKLSWSAPTTNASGTPLTDLLGYKIRWRTSPLEDWRIKDIFDPNAISYTFDEDARFQQGVLYFFELYAFDSGQQLSTVVTKSHTTTIKQGDHTVYPPTDPVATSRLGTVRVQWNGRLRTGVSTSVPAPSDIAALSIYVSTTPGFTPSSANLVSRVRVFGSDGGFDILTNLVYGNSYYIKITVSNTSGVESAPSNQVTSQVQPLVDTDIITSTLTTWPFNNGVVPAGALASGAINASSMFGNDVVVQSAIAAGAIGANEIAAGSIIAGKIGASAVTADKIAAFSISADKINTNAITADKINAGAITAIKINAGAITAEKISAGAITAEKIAATTITADKFSATLALASNMIIQDANPDLGRIEIRGSAALGPRGIVAFKNSGGGVANSAFRFYTDGTVYLDDVSIDTGGIIRAGTTTIESGKITSGSTVITSGVITGGLIRTAASGQRVEMRGAERDLVFRDSNGTIRGEIDGTSVGMALNGNLGSRITMGVRLELRARKVSGLDPFTLAAEVTGDGIRLSRAPTTTFAANLRRNSADSELAIASSDARVKENILPITNGLSVIQNLKPVTFNSIVDESDKIISGFIAQDVRDVFPSEIFTIVEESPGQVPEIENVDAEDFSKNPLLGLNQIEILPYLTRAIQELSQKNSDLENRIAFLESSD